MSFTFPAKFYAVFFFIDEETEVRVATCPRSQPRKWQRQISNPAQPDSRPLADPPGAFAPQLVAGTELGRPALLLLTFNLP